MELPAAPARAVGGLSLKAQFLLGVLAVLVLALVLLGTWLTRQIEQNVVHRTAAATALYVDSLISAPLQGLGEAGRLSSDATARLDTLLENTPLGRQVALFRVWDRDGQIVYSTQPALVGKRFPVEDELAGAMTGRVVADIGLPEGAGELPPGIADRDLLEIYSPVRSGGTGDVIAAAEFYYDAADLRADLREAKLRSWLVLTAAAGLVGLALLAFVQRASTTIERQQAALVGQVSWLSDLLVQNERLHDRVRTAAARTTALNERFLRRVAAELHDGPAQEISLALLRLDRLHDRAPDPESGAELTRLDDGLRRALQEVRATSSGLLLPHLADLSPAATVEHAVHGHRKRTGVTPEVVLSDLPADAPLPTKIALYRIVQEALTNAARHAPGAPVTVVVGRDGNGLRVEVADSGPGFAAGSAALGRSGDLLGLVGMRERAESLGGEFRVASAPGQGTRVVVRLPLRRLVEEAGTAAEGNA